MVAEYYTSNTTGAGLNLLRGYIPSMGDVK